MNIRDCPASISSGEAAIDVCAGNSGNSSSGGNGRQAKELSENGSGTHYGHKENVVVCSYGIYVKQFENTSKFARDMHLQLVINKRLDVWKRVDGGELISCWQLGCQRSGPSHVIYENERTSYVGIMTSLIRVSSMVYHDRKLGAVPF